MLLHDSRSNSLSSSILLSSVDAYTVDTNKLYEYILKIVVLEYINEARFKTQIVDDSLENSLTTVNSPSKRNRNSRIYGLDTTPEAKFSSTFFVNLELYLKSIALKKTRHDIDENARRSLLRFYSELLDPRVKEELKSNNTPDYILMKFVASANKEVMKIGTFQSSEVSSIVFKHANIFVSILVTLVDKEKHKDLIITKLQEHKDSLNPNKSISSKTSSTSSLNGQNAKYLKPSFKITDMDQGIIQLIESMFGFNLTKLQQDLFKVKDLAQEKTLQQDINQLLFYLDKDLGQFVPTSFTSIDAYNLWKEREKKNLEQLQKKYPVPASMKLLQIPRLPAGEDFYVLPPNNMTRSLFVYLVKLCFQDQKKTRELDPSAPLVLKQSVTLVNLAAKFWRIDYTTRVACIYSAANIFGLLDDDLYESKSTKNIAPIHIENAIELFSYCKRVLEDQGGLNFAQRDLWSIKDQEEWAKNVTISYNSIMVTLKELISSLFSKIAKPKFGPVLEFLGTYIESDPLFYKVQDAGYPKKWERRLSKTLLKTAESKYAELLTNLPRDNSLNIVHVLDISDEIVKDIQNLQRRYKSPLLGFLHVPRTVATVITSMFAVDSKNILKHIQAYNKKKNEHVHYGDAMEAYKSLYEIRDIYNQVSTTGTSFKFDLEKFFFPYLHEWAIESGEKINDIINGAIKNDSFEPIDLSSDDKKFSTSVLDIFKMIKEFLKILELLKWSNEYQLAKVYTILLKSISDGVLSYTSKITDKIMFELNEEEQKKLLQQSQEQITKRKSGWFDEVKKVVNDIQIGSKIETEEPYNFHPKTCVALNNLAAMMQQLNQLEEILDPELILKSVAAYEPELKNNFTSHVFSLRLVKAENLASNGTTNANIRPYVTLIDTMAKRTIGKSRTVNNNANPEWDEEFEFTIKPNTSLTLSVTVWDEKLGSHSICGRAIMQLDPRRFKHDGIPQEIVLDLDSQGRLLLEVAIESERVDAIFVMGRAHRALNRAQERCIKLIVEKFSRFIHLCFSRQNLKSICGGAGNVKPTQEQMDDAMMPLYDYLNSNLQVLAEYLTKDLLLKVMVAAWQVVVSSADQLLLPKLVTAKTFNLSQIGSKLSSQNYSKQGTSGWQNAVSSAVANVTNSIGISGFGKLLTSNELETVFSWLNFLCFDFFHNDGNGPPVKDLKNEHYQALLLLPVYYDRDVKYLKQEVERLSPAFVKHLRDRNNFDTPTSNNFSNGLEFENVKLNGKDRPRSVSRAGTMAKNKTIMANATLRARNRAKKELLEARSDPIAAQTAAEDIILRLLLIRDEKSFVSKRLDQREKLAHTIATERLARAAAEGRFNRS